MKSMSVSKLRVIPGLVVVGLLFVSIGDTSFAAISATSTSYQYDDAGRLKMVVVDPSQLSTNNVATYSYDSDGNVLSMSRSTSTGLNVLSYSPLRGVGGNQVIIYGTGFSSTPSSNTVKFNGTAATVAASTDTEIITSVPTGATTGPISVKVGTTTKTGTQTFTVGPNAPPPTVTGFSPTIAAPGDALNVTGTHFDTQSINDLALLGKTLMAVSGSTSTSLTTTVPGSTGTGHVTVENSDGSATSSGFLFVPPAGHTVADVAVTGTATLGTASLVNFTSAGKIGLLAFDGTAGQRVSVNLVAPSGGSSLQLIAHLLGPDGTSIEDGVPSGSGTSFLDTVTLPSDGTYTVEIEGINGTTGGTNVTVYNVNDINQAITPTSSGVAKTVTLNVPGMNATYTFTGSQNNRFSFVFSNISGTTPVTVTDPSGNTVVSGTVYSFGTYLETGYLTNPTTGTYSIKFDPVGAAANGSFTMTAYKVPADTSKAITIGGAAITVSNSTPGQNMLSTFSTTTASKKVTLTMSSVTGLTSGTVSFIDSNGTVYGGAQGWGISGGSFNATLGAAGSYKILVDPAGAGIGSVHLQLANGTFALAPSPPPTPLATKQPPQPPTFKLVGLDEWQPDPATMWNWKAAPATSPYQSYPLPAAARGVTAVAGRVLTVAGRPLPGVSLSIGKHVTRTDRDGRFVLRRVPSGHQVLLIDGSTATNTQESFGVFEDGVDLVNGKTNRLPYTTWMTALDVKHEVHFTYPITHTLTITNPQIPGLEVKIPAGSVLTNDAGKRVTKLGITPIPVNRPPFPLPVGVDVPIYFTVQPGSTYISKGARIIYPNYTHVPPGTRGAFWNYDPDHRGWYIYGHGTVTPNGKQVVPDPGVRVWEFTGAMWNPLDHLGPIWDAFQDLWDTATGDPVDPTTGLLNLSKTDMSEPGRLPLDITRTYRQGDTQVRDFGVGQTFAYDMFLQSRDNAGVSHQYDWVDLILPSGARIHFDRINGCPTHDSPCSDFQNGIFEADSTPTRYFHAQIKWRTTTADGWNLTLQDGTVMHFGENAPLQDVTDRFGNKITITRTAGQDGAITQVTSSSGRWIHFSYTDSNCSSCISQAVDQSGRTVNYTYTAAKQLIDVQDVDGNHTVYTWNPSAVDQITAIKDPRQNTYLQNTYDANDRVHIQTTPSGTYQFNYTLDGNNNVTQTDVTNPDGNVTRYVMNSTGVITSATGGYGTPIAETTTFERDPTTQRLVSVTDALGRKTSYSYFSDGNFQTVTHLATSAHPLTWNYTWDPQFHQLASVTDPLGHSENLTWTNGSVTTLSDGRGKQTTYAYNGFGEPKSRTDPLGHKWTYGYLNSDETSVTDPLGDVTTRQIDSAGRTTSVTDPAGQVAKYTWDAADNLLSATLPGQGQTQFHYDQNGNNDWVKDPLLNQTTFQYDAMNRLTSITDSAPTPKSASYTYYPSGLMNTYTDRRGEVTEYHYDALGRPSTSYLNKVGANFDRRIDYTFDSGNRLTGLSDSATGSPSATISRGYDGLNDVTNETVTAAGAQSPRSTVDYTYDDAGRPATMHVAGQTMVNYTIDAANRLTDVTQGALAVHEDYNDADQPLDLQLPGGVSENVTADAAGQITGITYKQGTTTLGDLQYAYDASGRRTAIGGTWSRVSLPGAVSGLTYDSANRLNSWNGQALSYDANGNLTNDGTRMFTWDASNELTSVSQGGSTVGSFTYDATGRRVKAVIGSVTRQFVYGLNNVVQEQDGSGASTSNSITSLGPAETFVRTDSTGQRSLLSDALGSTLALTDSAGAVQTSYTYSPFGDTTVTGQANGNPTQYAGLENDGAATGLYFMEARYYSPAMSRFASQDPTWFGGGTSNLYEYAYDQPTGYTDPSGLGPGLVAGLCGGGQVVTFWGWATAGVCVYLPGWLPGEQKTGASFTYGGGENSVGMSADAYLGPNVSDACKLSDLRGWFSNTGASAGQGYDGGGANYYHGATKTGHDIHGVEVQWTPGGSLPLFPFSAYDGHTNTFTAGGAGSCPAPNNSPKIWKSIM